MLLPQEWQQQVSSCLLPESGWLDLLPIFIHFKMCTQLPVNYSFRFSGKRCLCSS